MKSLARTAAGCLLVAFVTAVSGNEAWGATVSLEVATERGVQATAPQQWLQLLSEAGVTTTRIRGAQAGDKPDIETIDGRAGTIYRVTGVLNSRGQLRLPGGSFTRRDRVELRDYFDRLKADGAEAMTAPTGTFGLTKKQFQQVFGELSQPATPRAEALTTAALVERLRPRLASPIVIQGRAAAALQSEGAVDTRVGELTIGTALAISLRQQGLSLVPQKPRGKLVELHIVRADDDTESWPIGYEVKGPPRPVAPDLMEAINVEIDGFTLAEATAAITPRLKLPVFWDRSALARHKIDPAAIDVRLPRSKMSYKRILEKLLFQARLRGQLRTDEAGTPFYWIGR
ncbi:MAG: hypothetical protein AAF589_02015 [Planctomycetota bacterium]